MTINLSEIMSVKGQVKNIQAPFQLKSLTFENMEYTVVSSTPINLTLSHIGERKVKIQGETKVSLLIPCNRCLKEVVVPFDIEFNKEFDFRTSDEDRIKELDETNYLSEYDLDLDLLIYNEILLDFPMKVLCQEDCKGICSNCGANRNNESCDCKENDLDPRMAAIQDIFNKFKEV